MLNFIVCLYETELSSKLRYMYLSKVILIPENVSCLRSKNVISAFQVMRGEVFPLVNFKSYTGEILASRVGKHLQINRPLKP